MRWRSVPRLICYTILSLAIIALLAYAISVPSNKSRLVLLIGILPPVVFAGYAVIKGQRKLLITLSIMLLCLGIPTLPSVGIFLLPTGFILLLIGLLSKSKTT